MRRVRSQLARLAQVPWPVRLEGPTGSGKGVAARLLHRWSGRGVRPFVALNLNVLSDGLEIAELVGHVRGAYTGAVSDQVGAFEAAHGGTLFLDELAAASPRVQRALLQLIEEGTLRRLGEQRTRRVDVRLLFATNTDLEHAVVAGEFRRDLYYRLGTLVVQMPPLAAHAEDIPELVRHILDHKGRELGTPIPDPSAADLATLIHYSWPGNVRQLDRVLEHYATFGRLPAELGCAPRTADWRAQVDAALARTGGNKSRAARQLGISRKTLHEELKRRQA